MPVYEYVCTVCEHPVEVMHSYTAQGPRTCERCGAPMRKALSTPAIVFKGSGWAKKDQRDKVHASKSQPASTKDGDAATPVAAAAGEGQTGSTSTPADTSGSAAAPTPAPAAVAAPSAGPASSKGTSASTG